MYARRHLRLILASVAAAVAISAVAPIPPAVAEAEPVVTETLLPQGAAWAYLDTGADPGPTWATAGFDDQTWQTGNAQFGYGDGDETTVVSFGPDPNHKYATTYFRKTITVTDAHQLTAVDAVLTYDDAVAIHLNGSRIFTTPNLPIGFGHRTWATVDAEETITIPLDPGLFSDGDNTIAVEIHQAWRKSSDISFDLALNGTRQVVVGPPAPTAIDDRVVTPPGVAVGGTVADNDRANDAAVPVWSVAPADLPDPATVGGLNLDPDGAFQFTPTVDHRGTIVVPYTACNGTACAGAQLTILVIDGAPVEPGMAAVADPGPRTVTAGLPVDIELDVHPAIDGTGTVLTVQGLPEGLTVEVDPAAGTARIVGTATTEGTYPVSIYVVVTEDQSHATVTFELTVDTAVAGSPAGSPTEHPAIDVLTLDTAPETGQHGVLGFNVDDSTAADVRVWDMQQLGDHMYVGGEFQQVQQGAGGAIIDQAFLARFHLDTGHHDPTFTPTLDGNVHALEVAPRGVLLVGGEFTSIDGVANTSALAAIDPASGQVDTSFRASIERPWSNNDPIVRELEVVGDLVYIAGNFSHLRDRQTNKRERFYKAARVDADHGEPDLTWRPEVTGGSVYGLGVDQDRGRVLLSGSFSAVGARAGTGKVAVVDTVIGGVVPHSMPATAWTVFDIEYANDKIFLANGWNNQVTVHRADDFALLHQYQSDGDFQFIEKIGDQIFIGCHCTQDPLYPTARVLDATTGLPVDITFDIGGNIEGAWTVATDDRGCAWIGGDIWNGGFNTGTVWARGFARFCPD